MTSVLVVELTMRQHALHIRLKLSFVIAAGESFRVTVAQKSAV